MYQIIRRFQFDKNNKKTSLRSFEEYTFWVKINIACHMHEIFVLKLLNKKIAKTSQPKII